MGEHPSGRAPAENALSFARRTVPLPISFVAHDRCPAQADMQLCIRTICAVRQNNLFFACNFDIDKAISWRSKAVEAGVRLASSVLVSLRYRPRIALRKLFGIIARAVRLRNFVGTAAVKSPDPMRDVAQFRCDQTGVMKVDGLVGTWRFRNPNLDGFPNAPEVKNCRHFIMRRQC